METQKIIPYDSISISTNAYKGLQLHCEDNDIDVKKLYLYEKGGDVIVGFTSVPVSKHIELYTDHWKPTYTC